MIVDCSWISEMSWFNEVTTSCCRLVSMEKLRSSGCVYCADQFGVYKGSNSAVVLVVVARVLLKFARNVPPPHLTLCARPALNCCVPATMPLVPPASVDVGAVVADCCRTLEVSSGR